MPAERTDITLTYLRTVTGLVERIHEEEYDSMGKAAEAVAAQVRQAIARFRDRVREL
jgi:hypothetical protein